MKCPKHNAWMKVNRYHKELGRICELCKMEEDAKQKKLEEMGGFNHPPVRITKL